MSDPDGRLGTVLVTASCTIVALALLLVVCEVLFVVLQWLANNP